ncbi:MAG: YggS family pyridoxal phosphate-dependent enzyme [Oligoflexales bacterium]
MALTSDLQQRWQDVHSKIQKACDVAQRARKDITLLAVSKGQSVEKIKSLYEFGQRDFGENYFNELCTKIEALASYPDIRWHYIGKIQSNKIKKLVNHCAVIHTLCSLRHAEALSQTALSLKKSIPVFVEVNTVNETNKGGIAFGEVDSFVAEISGLPGLHLEGLMAIPPASYADEEYRGKPLPDLYVRLRQASQSVGSGLLSLGMSGDLELAVRAGSNFLRIGQALFGPRQKGNVL